MKLEINKTYCIFTTSDYISNRKVKVLGFIGYDRASQYKSFVENIAINEKFIDALEDTDSYLRSQIYYDCGVLDNINGELKLTGEHIIIWDDILDLDKSSRLYEEHVYRLGFTFKDIASTDSITKEQVIEVIKNAIDKAFNVEKTKVSATLKQITDNSIDAVESQLEKTAAMLDKANETLGTFVSLQDAAKSITTDIIDNNMLDKVNSINNQVETILANTETIIQNTQ